MKAIKKEMIDTWEVDDEQSIDNAIDELKTLRKEYLEKGYFDLWLTPSPYREHGTMYVYGSRIETEEEYQKRMEAERKREATKAARAATRREKDLAQFEKLKKKLKL
jgi:hypothetical protein